MGIREDVEGNGYQFKTSFYGIPVAGKEKLRSEVEKTKWTIVENQLIAANKGIYCAVFEDGEYRLINNMNGTFTVMLGGTGQNYALMGILNGGLVHSSDAVIWEGLKANQEYWLYAAYKDGMFKNPGYFERVAEPMKMANDARRFLLLAKVNADGTIDSCPPGKVYSEDVAKHTNDDVNPHGEVLTQDEVVLKRLKSDNKTLYNGTDGVLDIIMKRGVVSVQCDSVGPVGKTITVPGAVKILFAHAQEVFSDKPSFNLGQVICKWTDNTVTVYNSGSSGVQMNVSIIADMEI